MSRYRYVIEIRTSNLPDEWGYIADWPQRGLAEEYAERWRAWKPGNFDVLEVRVRDTRTGRVV